MSNYPFFRTDKMCRERWISHLDPSLKRSLIYFNLFLLVFRNYWCNDEDIILLSEYLIHSKKWSNISLKLPGRNVHSVKNRFYSLLNQNEISMNSPDLLGEISRLLKAFKQNSNKKIKSENQKNQFPNVYYNSTEGNQQNNYFFAPYPAFSFNPITNTIFNNNFQIIESSDGIFIFFSFLIFFRFFSNEYQYSRIIFENVCNTTKRELQS